MVLFFDHVGMSFYSQNVCDVFHWVWCCPLIMFGCHSTLRMYVMSFIVMLPADHVWVSFYSQLVCDVFHWVCCCLLIMFGCHSTLRKYVMSSIGCGAAC